MRKIVVVLLFAFLMGCNRGVETDKNSSTNSNAQLEDKRGSEREIKTSKTPESTQLNDAATLTPVINAYYQALKNKDEKSLRQLLSSDTLKSLEADMKAEGKRSLVEFISELETIPEKPYEVRNEVIEGDKAVAEIRGGNYLVWTKFLFVKEKGEWKITNKSPEFEIKKTQ